MEAFISSEPARERPAPDGGVRARLTAADWPQAEASLDSQGWALLDQILSPVQCDQLTGLYGQEERFRKTVAMARHGYGQGEYKYLAYPLPDLVQELRAALYARLQPIANRWNETMGIDVRYPATHAEFLERCHRAGQLRPTPLLLKYGEGDFNCLHQDVYGEHVFPLQAVILLSGPDEDFTGGEFVLTEQRPRLQSRPAVVPLRRGDIAIFATRQRPVRGTRGSHRVVMRHGVSPLRSGHRHTAGIIFHDAT